jgi:hypothetical protein
MSKITVMIQDASWFISRYDEDDELVEEFQVCNSLPEAKRVLKAHLYELLEKVDKIQLKDIK